MLETHGSARIGSRTGRPPALAGRPIRPRVNNGINGDARQSSVELGRRVFDIKVEMAVRPIQACLAGARLPRV